jgi:ABC-2 type transport system permease protein
MIQDIWTVAWKELKLISQGGSRGKIWMLAFPAIFGIAMPIQAGRAWLDTPAGVAFWAFIPLILVGAWVADAFAGERERHTLETLLASRLSDRAILLGKIGSVVAFAWVTSLVVFLIGMVTANAAFWSGNIQFYPFHVTLTGVGLSLLSSTLAANAGVLISLRAATVRQAQQMVTLSIVAIVWIPIIGLNLANNVLKLPKGWLTSQLSGLDETSIVLVALGGLLLASAVLFLAALARFQRAKLILD